MHGDRYCRFQAVSISGANFWLSDAERDQHLRSSFPAVAVQRKPPARFGDDGLSSVAPNRASLVTWLCKQESASAFQSTRANESDFSQGYNFGARNCRKVTWPSLRLASGLEHVRELRPRLSESTTTTRIPSRLHNDVLRLKFKPVLLSAPIFGERLCPIE
jgi:hypothetical protein